MRFLPGVWRPIRTMCLGLTGVLLGVGVGVAPARAQHPAAATTAPATTQAESILANNTVWRCCFVNRKPVVRVGQELRELWLDTYNGVWRTKEDAKGLQASIDTPVPPADWAAPDFDDPAWTRLRGPFFPTQHGWAYTPQADDAGFLAYEGAAPSLAGICVRGRFMVTDPTTVGELKLSLAYRGGIVVYLNGREIARAHLPDADRAAGVLAPAEDYPKEVFVKADDGAIKHDWNEPAKYYAQVRQRIRRLSNLAVPAGLLRKGINVLAIEGHRSPYCDAIYGKGRSAKGYLINWSTVGIVQVELTATGGGAASNVGRPAGLQVWNQQTDTRVQAADYGNPCEPLRPIRLVAARNGAFSGEVVVGSPGPLTGLKAVAGELKGPGAIPASAVQVRYALADRDEKLAFETLSPDAPAEVAVDKAGGGAVMPVWVTVKVPADARPGDYSGGLTITANGARPIVAPISLHVVDWTLPDSKDFISHVGLTESPESVAMRYKVPLWSPEHWKRLDGVFELMGQAGADDVYITALRRTHYGNEHAMIRRVKLPDGTLGVDLSIAQKYLDLAIKHLGKVPVVCVYCWEPCSGSSYLGGAASGNKGLPYTLVDLATGELTEAEGPAWGTPQVREFWKPVFDGMRELLKQRGMEASLMVGVAGDRRPNKDAVEDLKAVAPQAKWVLQSHATGFNFFGQTVGYLADVWNSPRPPDPAVKRVCGWKEPFLRVSFPREGSFTLIRPFSPLAQYRLALETASTAGIHGLGRVGADFWNVLTTRNKTYGHGISLIARYPEGDWGQLYLGNSTSYVLAPGPHGALATARFEMIREGAQDVEARVFLEKVLLDPALRARLGADLAARCQQLLDNRVRALLLGRSSWLLFTGGPQRLEQLYDLAAEAAGRLAHAARQ